MVEKCPMRNIALINCQMTTDRSNFFLVCNFSVVLRWTLFLCPEEEWFKLWTSSYHSVVVKKLLWLWTLDPPFFLRLRWVGYCLCWRPSCCCYALSQFFCALKGRTAPFKGLPENDKVCYSFASLGSRKWRDICIFGIFFFCFCFLLFFCC